MRAWVAPRYGPPEVLRLRELPDPAPGPGQALVRVRAIGLNFADCAARLGVYPRVPQAPFVPGMEVSGEVAALGEGVAGPQVGTPVAAVPIFGGHAELVAVDARFLRPLPPGIDFVAGAAVAVTGLTADHALFTVGRLRAGERIAITAAAGGVGTIAVQMAAAAGARVLAVASSPAKRELAASLGAHETTGYEGYRSALADGVDVVADAVGGALFRPGWKALRPDGRYVLYGFAAALGPGRVRYLHAALELLRMGALLPSALVQATRSLSGFNLSLVPHLAGELQARFARVEGMLAAGALRPVVGAVFPFARLPEAHAFLQSRASTGKIVVTL
ncbi:MAG: zinc-binding dehydrogenase [Thermoanaerobaculaceae bacterium]|nr:zinc-binding dehydrogenase [Thermoanaerobaculaceae bacterium]TAM56644.1 MAG: oxidoreductase [Acidobacteriota bacterium]